MIGDAKRDTSAPLNYRKTPNPAPPRDKGPWAVSPPHKRVQLSIVTSQSLNAAKAPEPISLQRQGSRRESSNPGTSPNLYMFKIRYDGVPYIYCVWYGWKEAITSNSDLQSDYEYLVWGRSYGQNKKAYLFCDQVTAMLSYVI